METVIRRSHFSSAAFVQRIGAIESRDGWSWARDGAREVVSLLKEVDDFEAWASSLRTKAESRRARRRHK